MKVKCSVCNDDSSVKLADGALSIYRCSACPHTFKDIPADKQERYEKSYFDDAHKNWFKYPDTKLYDYIYKEAARFAGDRKIRILDVGCGNGSFLKFLSARKPAMELYGIDFNDNESKDIHFIRGDIMKDKIDKAFDVVTSLAVIEHVDSPNLMVKKLWDLTVPSGIVFIMTDDDGSMIYGIARLLKRLGIRAPHDQLYELHHLQCFTKKSLRALMEKNGFEVIGVMSHNYPLKGVDLPKTNPFMEALYRSAVGIVFFLSTLFGDGILQTMVCKKRPVHGKA